VKLTTEVAAMYPVLAPTTPAAPAAAPAAPAAPAAGGATPPWATQKA
jgi:hypothetical protein